MGRTLASLQMFWLYYTAQVMCALPPSVGGSGTVESICLGAVCCRSYWALGFPQRKDMEDGSAPEGGTVTPVADPVRPLPGTVTVEVLPALEPSNVDSPADSRFSPNGGCQDNSSGSESGKVTSPEVHAIPSSEAPQDQDPVKSDEEEDIEDYYTRVSGFTTKGMPFYNLSGHFDEFVCPDNEYDDSRRREPSNDRPCGEFLHQRTMYCQTPYGWTVDPFCVLSPCLE